MKSDWKMWDANLNLYLRCLCKFLKMSNIFPSLTFQFTHKFDDSSWLHPKVFEIDWKLGPLCPGSYYLFLDVTLPLRFNISWFFFHTFFSFLYSFKNKRFQCHRAENRWSNMVVVSNCVYVHSINMITANFSKIMPTQSIGKPKQ